jgi:hypothetical protein
LSLEIRNGYVNIYYRGGNLLTVTAHKDASRFSALFDLKALEEGVPYQTLIASVLHKYVTGRLTERPARSSRR